MDTITIKNKDDIYSLSYVSTPVIKFNLEETEKIFTRFINKNKENDVTGILVIFPDFYWQTIEGPLNKIINLYNNIHDDKRHNNIKTIHNYHKIESRLYSHWNMKIVYLSYDKFDETDTLLYDIVKSLYYVYNSSHKFVPNFIWNNILLDKGRNIVPYESNNKVILFSNILSYSDFCKIFNSNDFYLWLSKINQIFINCVIKHNGIIVSVVGDCIIATFDSNDKSKNSLKAIQCAIDYQQTLTQFRESTVIPPHNMTYSCISIFYGQLNYNIEDIIYQNSDKIIEMNSWINISTDIFDEICNDNQMIGYFSKNSSIYNSYGNIINISPKDAHEKINEWIGSQSHRHNLRITTVL